MNVVKGKHGNCSSPIEEGSNDQFGKAGVRMRGRPYLGAGTAKIERGEV